MKNVAWFIIGCLFAYEAIQLFPKNVTTTTLISNFILQPLGFFEGAIFILASFLTFSYSIRQTIITLVNQFSEKRRESLVYGIIGSLAVLIAWTILFFESIYVSLAIVILTLIHLGLSVEKFKKVTYKER